MEQTISGADTGAQETGSDSQMTPEQREQTRVAAQEADAHDARIEAQTAAAKPLDDGLGDSAD